MAKQKKEDSDALKMKKIFIHKKPEGYLGISVKRFTLFTTKDKFLLQSTFLLNILSILCFLGLLVYPIIRPSADIHLTTTNGQVYKIGSNFNKDFLNLYIENKKNNVKSKNIDKTVSNVDIDKKELPTNQLNNMNNVQNSQIVSPQVQTIQPSLSPSSSLPVSSTSSQPALTTTGNTQ